MGKAINSCQKGKRAERRAAEFLRSLGFGHARRGQQYSGIGGADVVNVPGWHIEVKDDARVRLGTAGLVAACEQAARDCPSGRRPCVLWWTTRVGWTLTWRHELFGWVSASEDECIYAVLATGTKEATNAVERSGR